MFEETKEENLDNNSWLSTTKTVFKIALIGAAGVGKTSILHRIGGMRFDPRYCPTVGYKEYVVDMLGVRLLIKEYPVRNDIKPCTIPTSMGYWLSPRPVHWIHGLLLR